MENLNSSHDLDKIISLYETESKRKKSIFTTIIDKIKSLFIKKPRYSFNNQKTIVPSPTPITETVTANEPVMDSHEQLAQDLEEQQEIQTDSVIPNDEEFNLESLREFFKNNISTEQENFMNEIFDNERNQETNQLVIEQNYLTDMTEQQMQPEFSSRSYFQRIQAHAKLESENEQIWRRRQSILNGHNTGSSSSQSNDPFAKK